MAKNNNGNGFTNKDMLTRIMDNQDKSNEKWSSEMKRLYDGQKANTEEIMKYNYAQDKTVNDLSEKVTKIDSKVGIIWKLVSGALGLLASGVVGLFFKK